MTRIFLKGFFVICILLMTFAVGHSQDQVYRTNKGYISFRSDAPLEIISASSNALEGIIDHEALTFAFVVPITSFKGFNNGLQQQHFYENYLEATKYPEATFSGKIIEFVDLTKPGTYSVRAKGQLHIHGRSQERIIKVELISDGLEINATSRFLIPLIDHQIEIPKVVNQKIAQEIKVNVRATLALTSRS
ncbi:MAG TPA: YceI family protein [Saprospiraceae bacterium]|nr:YceI family protein [Saprospiraceae bacterium]